MYNKQYKSKLYRLMFEKVLIFQCFSRSREKGVNPLQFTS